MPSIYLADFPEPDRIDGAPHPRETAQLFGHRSAQEEYLASYTSGRAHHAWLITGPQGIGKATLAWKIARFLLATPPDDGGMFAPPPPQNLDVPHDHPVSRRLRALSEPGIFLLRRGLNQTETALSQIISVDDVREMKEYFQHKTTEDTRRVCIIDAADDLNPNAANALLKLLEEPPAGVTFLLLSHAPFRLLPTIRSRCRELRLSPLAPQDLSDALTAAGGTVDPADRTALAELAGGSVGEAFRLTNADGLELYARLIATFATLPRLDRPRALALTEIGQGRANAPRFDLILTLLDLFLARLARAGSIGRTPPEAAKGEAALIARLSPTPQAARQWADLAQSLGNRARRGKAVNLDPAALLMDMVLKIDETAGALLAQR